jgi:hypothetical protein
MMALPANDDQYVFRLSPSFELRACAHCMDRNMVQKGYAVGSRTTIGGIMVVRAWRLKLPSGRIQFSPQDADVPGSVQGQGYPVAGDPADLQNNAVPYVNPFTDFSTEHQHFRTPCVVKLRLCPNWGIVPHGQCIACCDGGWIKQQLCRLERH